MSRSFPTIVLLGALAFSIGCTNKKVNNPLANVGSKQPDKVLFDRAMDAMKHNRFDVARMTLQTLINTYPDSEFIARAKLAVGDSWYAEGGTAALSQAEIEYKDFETFFPTCRKRPKRSEDREHPLPADGEAGSRLHACQARRR
jgi:outer membrane protein assembly factor BamD